MKSPKYILIIVILLLTGVVHHESYAQKKKRKGDNKEITKYERANAEYLFIEAQKFFLIDDYARSLTFLNQSLEIDKGNHAAFFKIAEIHLLTGKNTEGIEAIQKAIKLQKNNRYYYILAAQLYKANNDLTAAANQYELMVANTTNYKEFLLDMSDLYVELGEYQKAINTLDLTEKEFGTPDKFAIRKKDLMLRAGQTEKAIDLMSATVQKKPGNLELIQEYTDLLINEGRTEEAISFMENQTSHTRFIKPNLIKLYMSTGLNDKAINLTQEVFATDELPALSRISIINDILQKPTPDIIVLAETELKELQQALPNNPNVLNLQSRMLTLKKGNGDAGTDVSTEKLQVLTKLVETDPSVLNNWKRLLALQYQAENWKDLLDYSEQSLDYFPNQGLFYFYYGSATLYTQETEEAVDLFEQALRLSSRSDSLKARIYGKQSEIAFIKKDTNEAASLFSQAIALVNHPEIINNYSFRLALQKVDLEKALELSADLVQENPGQLKYVRNHAFAYFQSANYTRSKQLLEEGFSQLPEQINGQARELYGDVLIKLDMVEEALAEWQKAKTLGNTSEKINQKIANKEYF